MRALLALLLPALLLAGCGHSPWADPSPDPLPVAEAEAEPAGPALRLIVRGRASYATPIQAMGERRLWRTPTLQVVETAGSRVVATAGFGEMLVATRFDGPDPLSDPAALLGAPVVARRMVDLSRADRAPEGMRFGVPVECRLRAQRAPEGTALLVEEHCQADGAGRFTNRFTVAAETGAVTGARQWIGPEAPMLEVEFLPPVAPSKPGQG